jgi:hypothetical protein
MTRTSEVPLCAVLEIPAGDHQAAIADLKRTVAQLEARVAQLAQPAAQWVPLKAAAHDCRTGYETCRKWAAAGLIEARREGGRWFVNVVSLKARLARLFV